MNKITRWPADHFALTLAAVQPEQLADDGVDRHGKVVSKPWGHEVEIYRGGAVSITRLVIVPGGETSMHCHPHKQAVLVVESGSITLDTLDGPRDCKAAEVVYIQPGAFHRIRSAAGAVLIEVETPPNKCDLVRIDDRYGRGQGYEQEFAAL